MFYKGYIHSAEEQRKAKSIRQSKNGKAICIICKEIFAKYSSKQITCGKKICTSKRGYELSKADPISYLSVKLFSTIRLGKGKIKIAYNLVKNAIGAKCPYCGIAITLENASVDHKIPRTGSKVFNRIKRTMIYTKEEISI